MAQDSEVARATISRLSRNTLSIQKPILTPYYRHTKTAYKMSWRNLSEEEQEWINKERWGRDINQAEVEEIDEKIATGHIFFYV